MGGGGGGAAAAAGAWERGGAGWLTLRDPGGLGSMARGSGPGQGTRAWPGQAGQRRGSRCPGWLGAVLPDRSGEGEAVPAGPAPPWRRGRGRAEEGGGDRESKRVEEGLGRRGEEG